MFVVYAVTGSIFIGSCETSLNFLGEWVSCIFLSYCINIFKVPRATVKLDFMLHALTVPPNCSWTFCVIRTTDYSVLLQWQISVLLSAQEQPIPFCFAPHLCHHNKAWFPKINLVFSIENSWEQKSLLKIGFPIILISIISQNCSLNDHVDYMTHEVT